jgi:hypothetical protein
VAQAVADQFRDQQLGFVFDGGVVGAAELLAQEATSEARRELV